MNEITRSEPHKVSRPLPGWWAQLWSRIRGYGTLWREPCDNCGQTAMMHHAVSSLVVCRRFRPIRVTRSLNQ